MVVMSIRILAGVWFYFSLLSAVFSFVFVYVLLADNHVKNVSYFPFMSIKRFVPYFCVLREGYYVIIWHLRTCFEMCYSHFWDRPVAIFSDVRFSYLELVQDKKITCVLPANARCTVYVNCLPCFSFCIIKIYRI
jgi:hypothetical protein